jgi:hypothetical protein
MNHFSKIALAAAAVVLAGHASAQVTIVPDSALTPTNHLYTNDLGSVVVTTGGGNAPGIGDPSGRNDDGFSGPIALGYTLQNFFGSNYSSIFVNNNGNITFNAGLPAFTPEGPQGATQPVIAPFFADVDTRGAASGVVHINQSIANETIITWDHVGYYSGQTDHLDTFQLVLRGSGFATPAGEGQIGFFYGDMQWETGGASGGTDGFGGDPAAVGFGDGQSNGEVLAGSTANGISGIVNDSFIWFDVNDQGIPTPTIPEPTNVALMLAGLGLLATVARRRNNKA